MTDLKKFHYEARLKLAYAMSWLVLGLASLAIAGWVNGFDALVQIRPGLAPIQFNTAVCFVLTSLSVILLLRKSFIVARVTSVMVLLFVGTTLLQYVLRIDFGIDEFFYSHHITDRTARSGRMAPSSAFAFMLCQISLLLHSVSKRHSQLSFLAQAMAGAAMGEVLLAFMGSALFGTPKYGDLFTDISIQAVVSFLLLGVSLIFMAKTSADDVEVRRIDRVATLSVAIFTIFVFVTWQRLEHNEWNERGTDAALALEYSKHDFNLNLMMRGDALHRMAEIRSENAPGDLAQWEHHARLLLRDFKDLNAIILTDSNYIVRGRVARDGESLLIGTSMAIDEARRNTFKAAAESRQVRLTPAVELRSGGLGLAFVAPSYVDGRLNGYITASIRAEDLLKDVKTELADRFAIVLRDSQQVLAQSLPDAFFSQISVRRSTRIDALGQEWGLEIIPTEMQLSRMRSGLPEYVLGFGALTLLLLVAGFIQARRAATVRTAADRQASRLTSTLESISDAFFMLDRDWCFSFLNREAERLLGRERQKLLGQNIWREFGDAKDSSFGREYQRAVAEGKESEFQEFYPPLQKWFSVRAFPVEEGLAIYFRDITEQRKQVQQSEYKAALLRIGGRMGRMGGWAADLAANQVDWSDEIFDILEWSPGESPPLEVALNMYPPVWRKALEEAMGLCASTGKPFDLELQINTAKGRLIWARAVGEAERDSTGRISRVRGAFQDITAQKQSEDGLKISEERFRLLSRATDDAIWDWDLRTNSLWWSEGLEPMLGYASDEVEPTIIFWEERIHPEDRVRVLKSKNNAIVAGDTRWSDHYRFLRKDGNYSDVRDSGHVIRDSSGSAVRMVGGMADISERLALEAQLRQSQRLESVGHLTGGLAHDFNNLLTVIMGNAELLEEVLAGDVRSRALAEMITGAAQRGAELTQRLLAFARKQPLDPKEIVINELTAGMEPLLRRTLGEHIAIEFVRGAGLWQALVDPAQLESALLNLCLNARDAMPDGGSLTMETGNVLLDQHYADQHPDVQPGQYVMVAVTDTGAGIAREHLGRVFEPFFTTKETGKGTGLGLAMVYGFIKQSGGHVGLYSELGEGTTVKLYLPRVMSEQIRVTEMDENVQPIGGTETILLVEDDDGVRRYAHDQLVSLGYTVIQAADGPQGLEIIKMRDDIDLLFTDVVMPGGMSGRVLADEAKKLRPKLKVLYTSGYTDNAIVHQGRLDPGVLLLTKPYRRRDLALRIREALAD